MPIDPLTSKLAGPAAKAASTGVKVVRRELARRRGSDELLTEIDALEASLDQAIEILANDPQSLPEALRISWKARLVRPDIFAESVSSDWIKTREAQVSVKAIVRAKIRGEDDSALISDALAHYAVLAADAGDGAPGGEDVLGEAVDFVLRSLRRDVTPGEAVLLETQASLRSLLKTSETGELADKEAAERLDRLRRSRFFASADAASQARDLSKDLIDGMLRTASTAVRADALAWCARVLAFKEGEDPHLFLEAAEKIASERSETLLVARAFLTAMSDWEAGLKLLDPDRSPVEATAMLQIMRFGLGTEAGLERADHAGLGAKALDSDGRYVLMVSLTELDRWDDAAAVSAAVSEADYRQTPALLWATAALLVASTVPTDLKPIVLQGPPASPAAFPLKDDGLSIEARRLARTLMLRAADHCGELKLASDAAAARRYALWLQLRDPDASNVALTELRASFRDPAQSLALLPLALGFQLEVDRKAAELSISRRLARSPGNLGQVAEPMLALLLDFSVSAPADALDFLKRHRETFERILDPANRVTIEVNSLAALGRREEARAVLESAPESLPRGLRSVLSSFLESGDRDASIEALEESYREDPQTARLLPLIGRYLKAGAPDRFVELAKTLLRDLPNSNIAADVVRHLVRHGRDKDALDALALAGDVVQRSPDLLAEAGWINFRQGRFEEAMNILEKLEAGRDHVDDRTLKMQLLIATGEWDALDGFLEEQWQHRAKRSAEELVRAANLAAEVGAKRATAFAQEAVAAAPDAPDILISAYMAATRSGTEDELPEAGSWILRAAEQSGENGPVQKASLADLVEGQPEWEARVEEALNHHAAGALPLELVGTMFRRSWLDMQLSPLLANPKVIDVRRQVLIPLFSGRAMPLADEPIPDDAISLDTSAIVTLAAFDALDPVLDSFKRVVVRHDVFISLFKERARLGYHQPSQIAFGRRLLELVARGKVQAFEATQIPDAGLMLELGRGRADMLSHAASQSEGQHLFIHPFPITRVGTLSSEAVPLVEYRAHLASCSAVVDALSRLGHIRKDEADAARAYLSLQEERWPDEPIIQKGATLYLSDLSVAYFRHVRLLDRIVDAGLIPIVSPTELDEAKALLEVDAVANEAHAVLTRIRGSLTRARQAGRLAFDAAPRGDKDEQTGQTLSSLARQSGFLVTDDRFLNRYERFDDLGQSHCIVSSIECLSRLAAAGRIEPGRLETMRDRLRRAGAAFVPVDAMELERLVDEAAVDTSADPPRLLETAELRALRENVRLIQARGWFDPKKDGPWLNQLHIAAADALAAQWRDVVRDDERAARSEWLLGLIDRSGWADSRVSRELDGMAGSAVLLDVITVTSRLDQADKRVRPAFETWVEERFIGPLLGNARWLRTNMLQALRSFVRSVAEESTKELGAKLIDSYRIMLNRFPKFLTLWMLEDESLQEASGLKLEATMQIGDAAFQASAVFEAVKALYAAPANTLNVKDESGRSWRLSTEPKSGWALCFRHKSSSYRVRGIAGLHPRPRVRVAILDRFLKDGRVRPASFQTWRTRLLEAPLSPAEMETLNRDQQAFPPFVLQEILQSLEAGGIEPATLVPKHHQYYERLVGPSTSGSLQEFLADPLRNEVDWAENKPLERIQWLLLRASQPEILAGADFDALSKADWRTLGHWAVQTADLVSKVAFGEHALSRAKADPELEPMLVAIAEQLGALDPQDKAGPIHLLSSLAIYVDAELSLHGVLPDWPPFRRRQAAIAHASLVVRAVFGQVETGRLANYCLEERGWRFAVQSLLDLRQEPRWRPDMISPTQLKNELAGRLSSAANGLDENLLTPALRAALTDETGSLKDHLQLPMIFWPGPLEGGISGTLRPPPPELLETIERGLTDEPLTFRSLNALINCEVMFNLSNNLVERAAVRIEEAGPRLFGDEQPEQVHAYLLGLATLAASHRLPALADTVRLLDRHLRLRAPGVIEAALEMQLMLTAAASREDAAAWRDAIGDWMLELSSRAQLAKTDAQIFLGWLETMTAVDPLLRTRTGRARAQLKLVTGT
ncbi:tetratricopeptide repeat protein [Sphingomonas hankyongi]|uniref:HTH domain-containing protein n=1 Tax=Sphingomonas hankyongi TaxID=2908209 RepID=A0ABT0S0C9_9SPHN|nr:hypothetical protein [Sphingomonas hankyongi]MCL6729191.1 hypothetical protein [Sphingomonas hankyongi]